MGKLLAIDYGEKNIGTAISNESKKLAFGLVVIDNRSKKYVLEQITEIVEEENINKIIVGLPLGLNNKNTKQTNSVAEFIKVLKTNIEIEVVSIDERFTSTLASKYMKGKKLKEKGELDIKAAQIILQNYLDKINN